MTWTFFRRWFFILFSIVFFIYCKNEIRRKRGLKIGGRRLLGVNWKELYLKVWNRKSICNLDKILHKFRDVKN